MLVFETEVLKFGLDGEQSEPMGQRGIYVECFASYFVLFGRGHGAEGAHVVQAVGHFQEHHTDVLAHGEQQFAEVFGLC